MEGWVEGLETKVIIGVIVGDDDTNTLSDGLDDEDFIDGLDEENDTGSGGGAPPEFATMATYLASEHARNITGQTINIDGGQVMHT